VDLTCTPPTSGGITCSLNPSSVPVNGATATAMLTIGTSSAAINSGEFWWLSWGGVVAAISLLPVGSRRRRTGLVCGVIAFVTVAAGAGCGGGSSSSGSSSHRTAAGNYNITITGTSGSLSHTATVRLKVH